MWNFLEKIWEDVAGPVVALMFLCGPSLMLALFWLVSPSKPVGNDRCCYREERVEERQRLIDLPTADQKDDKGGTSTE